jgi:hypothetical protein
MDPMSDVNMIPTIEDDKSVLQRQMELAKKEDEERRALLMSELKNRLEHGAPTIDWSPLAAQLDEMNGTKSTGIAATSSLRQGEQEEARVNSLFDKLTAPSKSSTTADNAAKQDQMNKRFRTAQDHTIEKEILGAKMKLDTDIAKAQSTFDNVDATFAPESNGEYSVKKVGIGLAQLARLFGEVGALTDNDADRSLMQDASLWADKWSTKLEMGGTYSKEDLRALIEKASAAKIAMQSSLKNRADGMVAGYASMPTYAHYMQPGGGGHKSFYDSNARIMRLGGTPRSAPSAAPAAPKAVAPKAPAKKQTADEMLEALIAKELNGG